MKQFQNGNLTLNKVTPLPSGYNRKNKNGDRKMVEK